MRPNVGDQFADVALIRHSASVSSAQRLVISNHMAQRIERKLQVGAAALGAGVLIAMGVITAAGSGDAVTASTEATTGETTTSETAPTTLETPKAEPPVTATTSQGEWAEMPPVDSEG